MTKVAVLDDWQGIAASYGDWDALRKRAEVHFLQQPLGTGDGATRVLSEFDILLTVQSRTSLPENLISRLPRLKMIGVTVSNASLDLKACAERGIVVSKTDAPSPEGGWAPAELALGMIIMSLRGLAKATANMREGRFQESVPVGKTLAGRTLGILGWGRLGSRLAEFAKVMGMNVIASSPNLDAEKAMNAGVTAVAKNELFSEADIVSIHVTLSEETRGLVNRELLQRMRSGSLLVNTSRGPIVDEKAMLEALRDQRIGAALDVFDEEPLPVDHPLRSLPNVTLTPHLGFGVEQAWDIFYSQSIENALAFLDGQPIRVVNA